MQPPPSLGLGQAVRLLATPSGGRSLIMVLLAGGGVAMSFCGGAFQPLYFLPVSLLLVGAWFLLTMLVSAPQEQAFQRHLHWNAIHLLPLAILGIAAGTRYLGWPTRMTSLFVGLSLAGVMGTILVRLPEDLWARLQRALDHRIRPSRLLLILVLLATVCMAMQSIIQHQSGSLDMYDLAFYDQMLWNTLQGRFLHVTYNPAPEWQDVCHLASHTDFLILLFLPSYFIHADPRILLVGQALGIALAAVPLYLLGWKVLGSRGAGLGIALAYLFYSPLQGVNRDMFHTLALAPACFLGGVYEAQQRRYGRSCLWLVLAVSAKENVSLATAMLGLWLILQGHRWYGAAVTGVSVGWFGVAVFGIIPSFVPGGSPLLLHSFWSSKGGTLGDILVYTLRHPSLFWEGSRPFYLISLLAPLAFLPLGNLPALMLAGPELYINLTSDLVSMRFSDNHYVLMVLPGLFLASIYGLRGLQRLWDRWAIRWPALALPRRPVLLALLLLGPNLACFGHEQRNFLNWVRLAWKYQTKPLDFPPSQWSEVIPPQASVVAEFGLMAHLSHRRYLFSARDAGAALGIADYALFRANRPAVQRYRASGYTVVRRERAWVLLKRPRRSPVPSPIPP